MEDMEKRQDEKDVNREVDRLTLRLKLTGDQKEALRMFLTDEKEKQRTAFRAMTAGTLANNWTDQFLIVPQFLTDQFLTALTPEKVMV